MLSRAPLSCVHVLVVGLYNSGMSPRQVEQVVDPDTTSTRPSGRVVAVGYHRGNAMGAKAPQVLVTGSNRLTSGIPTNAVPECPPAINALPSVMRTGPAQKMLSVEGTEVRTLVDQFHR